MAGDALLTVVFILLASGIPGVISMTLGYEAWPHSNSQVSKFPKFSPRNRFPPKFTGLKVIGAGLPRTGTESLDAALRLLGYHAVKGEDIDSSITRQLWTSSNDTFKLGWLVQHHAEAVTDDPYAQQYELLAKSFPSSKVILTQHPMGAAAWVRSTKELRRNLKDHPAYLVPGFGPIWIHPECIIQDGSPAADALCEQAYTAYNRGVIETVSPMHPKKLLVFNVTEGWKPLCHFLQVAVPQVPFPRIDHWGDENFPPDWYGKPSPSTTNWYSR